MYVQLLKAIVYQLVIRVIRWIGFCQELNLSVTCCIITSNKFEMMALLRLDTITILIAKPMDFNSNKSYQFAINSPINKWTTDMQYMII